MIRKVVVIGLGRFGASVARTLHDEGVEVVALDRDRVLVDAVKDDVTVAAACDATDRANLERFEAGDMDAAVIAIGQDFEASVHATLLCRELGVPRIVCKALTARQRQVLELVGAHEVILPEERMGRWVGENLVHDSVVNLVDLPDGYMLLKIEAPEDWLGSTLRELGLLGKERIVVVQVHRPVEDGQERIPLPDGDFQVVAGDVLDVIGPEPAMERFRAVRKA